MDELLADEATLATLIFPMVTPAEAMTGRRGLFIRSIFRSSWCRAFARPTSSPLASVTRNAKAKSLWGSRADLEFSVPAPIGYGMGRTFWQSICIVMMACGGSGSACGGPSVSSAEHTGQANGTGNTGSELTPFSGWSIPGVTLFRADSSHQDHSAVHVVGTDASGEMVRGVELMRLLGDLPAQELALRANAILFPFAGQEPLSPGYANWGSAQEQALIREARVDDGSLCYFAIQGDMNPGIVQRCVQLSDYSVTTRFAFELILASGENVVDENTICIAHSSCGGWAGCIRAQRIQRPGDETRAYQVVESGLILEHREECLNGVCFEVCRGPGESAHCDSGTFEALNVECTEAWPPSRADFHCETLADECRQVSH